MLVRTLFGVVAAFDNSGPGTLQANPATAAAGDAAATGMIHASKVTTGVAAAIITLGLAATWALPPTPTPPPAPPRQDTAARPAPQRPTRPHGPRITPVDDRSGPGQQP